MQTVLDFLGNESDFDRKCAEVNGTPRTPCNACQPLLDLTHRFIYELTANLFMTGRDDILNAELIDSYVLDLMKESGWSENRRYDVKYWIDELTAEGYVSFEYALEILESLGGLTFYVKDDGKHKGAQFDFNPYFAANGEFDRLANYELLAREELFPIGSMCSAIAYVGRSKKLYWGDINKLYWAGNSIEDYLNRLFDKNCKQQEINNIIL